MIDTVSKKGHVQTCYSCEEERKPKYTLHHLVRERLENLETCGSCSVINKSTLELEAGTTAACCEHKYYTMKTRIQYIYIYLHCGDFSFFHHS